MTRDAHRSSWPRVSTRQSVVGWGISIVLHAGLAGLFVWLSVTRSGDAGPAVPTTPATLEAGPPPRQAEIEPPTPEPASLEDWLPEPPDTPVPMASLAEMAASEPLPSADIGVPGIGVAAIGAQAGGFTISETGSQLGRSRFCGTGGVGTRLAYVVDCSGSMIIAMEYIRGELTRSIGRLTPAHCFTVILYAGGDPHVFAEEALVRANAAARAEAERFVAGMHLLKVESSQQAWRSAAEALERALQLTGPGGKGVEMVYFLTDGEFDHAAFEAAVSESQGRRGRPATIHVIACGNRDNEAFLKSLARFTGGTYHFVSDREMAETINRDNGE